MVLEVLGNMRVCAGKCMRIVCMCRSVQDGFLKCIGLHVCAEVYRMV